MDVFVIRHRINGKCYEITTYGEDEKDAINECKEFWYKDSTIEIVEVTKIDPVEEKFITLKEESE